ncbi:MAG: response regulator [Anaerolineales bacterium]|nr:response regulator [Anaerolineales bacterium]
MNNNRFAFIIEDDIKLATIFAYALEEVQFRTETAQDGRKALARLAEIVPDVIVLDLHLPFVSGMEVLKSIRADGRLANVPVILATADAILGESLRDEADLVLLKPISIRQLQKLTERLMATSS